MNDPTQSSDIQTPDGQQAQAAESPESPGGLLRAERERQGLNTADLARQLNLSTAKLEALEQDNFAKLPSEVFVQGYLRRYSKLLGLDDDQIVHHYNVLLGRYRAEEQASQLASGSARSGMAGPPRWLLPVGIFVIAVLILAFIFVQTASDEGSEPANSPPASQQRAPVEERQPAPSAMSSEPSAMSSKPGEEELAPLDGGAFEAEPPLQAETQIEASEPEVLSTSSAAADEGGDTASGENTDVGEDTNITEDNIGEDIVSFAFSEDCWVEVSNAEGTVIYQDLASAGESLNVGGEAPFSVLLGNARAASVSFNGEVVAVNPPAGNRTHRFTVGEGR